MSTKNRTELKAYFKAQGKPTESQFADFIDAGINQAEDGIEKKPGESLSITAEGDNAEVLKLSQNSTESTWAINLNPYLVADKPETNKPGLNIRDASETSRLFIDAENGNLGIGTIIPTAKLTIRGTEETSSLLSISDTKNTEILNINTEGTKATIIANSDLTINGHIISNGVAFKLFLKTDMVSNINPLPFEKEIYNIGGHFKEGKYFVAPMKGLYIFVMTLNRSSAAKGDGGWVLRLNETQLVNDFENPVAGTSNYTLQTGGSGNTVRKTIITLLSKGDMVHVQQKDRSGDGYTLRAGANDSSFSGALLCSMI